MISMQSMRRMFPSMRLSISGLEEESNYCVLLEMVPIGDCRYKFSGSQWVPAGGAEPQSPQRMFLHTDSPASGAHWQAQPILFNKVKLTNNTLDSNGHIVLASMHKYQPRIHIIRTSDPTQIPWSPQQAFVFPETEFVAVTAYQNDRITKLKIDNNPFAKGFRETGQSRCKRKMSSSPEIRCTSNDISPLKANSLPSTSGYETHPNDDDTELSPNAKRIRSNGSTCSMSSLDEVGFPISTSSNSTSGKNSPNIDLGNELHHVYQQPPSQRINVTNESMMVQKMQTFMNPSFVDLAYSYFERPQYPMHHMHPFSLHHHQPNDISLCLETSDVSETEISNGDAPSNSTTATTISHQTPDVPHSEAGDSIRANKSKNFSISAILGSKS
ncbi:T-box transcription factor TBX2-like isoform X2 [Episyrphus balteatus]|uniref:T-box transcription factor TBX2-like isoform X2 n=1 Tax=Episyrphus balteatus TaxID=286459 RepID=UPI0024850AA0|nr:T-box transcription factor TBX2-like isoform X2 [Episyrphus balteatus]